MGPPAPRSAVAVTVLVCGRPGPLSVVAVVVVVVAMVIGAYLSRHGAAVKGNHT